MDRSPRAESSRSYDGDRHRYRERSDRDRGSSYRDRDRDREHRDRDRDRDHRDRGRGRREERDDQPVDPERAIFVGNLDTYSTIDEVREMFEGLGEVRRVDMKQGFAFVFLESGHHRAVRELDGKLHNRKHLRVELARGDGLVKRSPLEPLPPKWFLKVVMADGKTTGGVNRASTRTIPCLSSTSMLPALTPETWKIFSAPTDALKGYTVPSHSR